MNDHEMPVDKMLQLNGHSIRRDKLVENTIKQEFRRSSDNSRPHVSLDPMRYLVYLHV